MEPSPAAFLSSMRCQGASDFGTQSFKSFRFRVRFPIKSSGDDDESEFTDDVDDTDDDDANAAASVPAKVLRIGGGVSRALDTLARKQLAGPGC